MYVCWAGVACGRKGWRWQLILLRNMVRKCRAKYTSHKVKLLSA